MLPEYKLFHTPSLFTSYLAFSPRQCNKLFERRKDLQKYHQLNTCLPPLNYQVMNVVDRLDDG